MSVLDEIAAKFKGYEGALDDFSKKILNSQKYKQILRDFNIENLQAGIRPDGSEIQKTPVGNQKSSGYERRTKEDKAKKGLPYDHVNLYNFGELYARLKVVSGSDSLLFYNDDPKYPQLVAIWGEFLGITEDQVKQFMEILYEDFNQFSKSYFNG